VGASPPRPLTNQRVEHPLGEHIAGRHPTTRRRHRGSQRADHGRLLGVGDLGAPSLVQINSHAVSRLRKTGADDCLLDEFASLAPGWFASVDGAPVGE